MKIINRNRGGGKTTELIKLSYKNNDYIVCHSQKECKRIVIQVHKLQAYQKFGNKVFEKGIQVRHLDNNSLNNSWNNIDIGTQSQNMMDIPKEKRIQKARNNIKYDWSEIDKDRENGMSYKKLTEKYGVKKGTLSYRYSKNNG